MDDTSSLFLNWERQSLQGRSNIIYETDKQIWKGPYQKIPWKFRHAGPLLGLKTKSKFFNGGREQIALNLYYISLWNDPKGKVDSTYETHRMLIIYKLKNPAGTEIPGERGH